MIIIIIIVVITTIVLIVTVIIIVFRSSKLEERSCKIGYHRFGESDFVYPK